MKVSFVILSVFTVFLCAVPTLGQHGAICDVGELERPKFSVAVDSHGESVVYRLSVKPKLQTDENLIQIAKYLKSKYCRTNEIIVTVFDNRKDAREFSVYGVGKLLDTPRAMYYLDRSAGKEKLVRVKVVDNKQVETPIELKLN